MIDLDAARAARAEREPRTLRFGGVDFDLPARMPVATGLAFEAARTGEFLASLLGDQLPAFLALQPDEDDFAALVPALWDEYRTSAGESKASPPRSGRTGKR